MTDTQISLVINITIFIFEEILSLVSSIITRIQKKIECLCLTLYPNVIYNLTGFYDQW